MDTAPKSTDDSLAVKSLTAAADRHGIALTDDQARLGAEWRDAMVNAVDAVRRLGVDGYEPAAVFAPVTPSETKRGG